MTGELELSFANARFSGDDPAGDFIPGALDRVISGGGSWNGEVGYRVSNRARLVLEAYNLFDAEVSDIDYFYASRLDGEPGEGIEDVHTHPAVPVTARIGRQFWF